MTGLVRNELTLSKNEVVAPNGMVVGEHPLIAEAGAEILLKGGNAVDAAVAAAFVAAVVEPFMSGIGGLGYMLIHDSRSGRQYAVEFTGRTPAAAGAGTFELDPAGGQAGMFGWPAVKDRANLVGYRAPLVPGTVAGLALALEKFGTMRLDQVLEPAIRYAEEGFPMDWYVSLNIAVAMAELREFPETATVFLPNGVPPKPRTRWWEPAETFRQPDLAETLKLIAREGPDAFYRGPIAARIAEAMAARGGLITREDLARYQPKIYQAPLRTTYREFEVVACPGPCAGTTLIQMLNIAEGFGLRRYGPNSAQSLHFIAETSRRAFADRFAYLADPDFADAPWAGLVSKDYAAEVRATIDPERATPEAGPGDPWKYEGRPAPARADVSAGSDPSCTTHLGVIDRDRNMVSLTNTLGELFGCRVVIPGTGILLNNGMVWFDPRPGRPNSLAGNKRPLVNMTPALVLHNGRPFMSIGAPGARRLITGIFESILNVLEFGLGIQAAVSAPRVHCEGPETHIDSRIPAETRDILAAMGHRLVVLEQTIAASDFGRPVGILIDPTDGCLHGGVHVQQPATAVGY
jgi:gamma-glutamyltranspeptidase/glutathione hydrolase